MVIFYGKKFDNCCRNLLHSWSIYKLFQYNPKNWQIVMLRLSRDLPLKTHYTTDEHDTKSRSYGI